MFIREMDTKTLFYFFLLVKLSHQHIIDVNNTLGHTLTEKLEKNFKSYTVPVDFDLNIFEYLDKYDYPYEAHTVTTEDGYILGLHRIQHGSGNIESDQNNTKPVVLLMHGLLCSSMDWIYLGPGKSLGLMLADAGYDVWLGNNRGNLWSRRHEELDPDKDKTFWDFSFHEFGYYDAPAFIDYILNKTGVDQIYYVGHSQGTAQFFAMASTRPEYNNKVAHMTALAPIAYLHRSTSIVPRFMAQYLPILQIIFNYFEIDELLRQTELLTQLGMIVCGDGSPIQDLCAQLIFLAAGDDSPQLNRSRLFASNETAILRLYWDGSPTSQTNREFYNMSITNEWNEVFENTESFRKTGGEEEKQEFYTTWLPVLFSSTPAGTSIKTIFHLLQLIRDDSFKQFDYGFLDNLSKYNSTSPPKYDLESVQVPIAIYYAQNDLFNARKDIDKLVRDLPNVVKFHTLKYKKFSHMDFLIAKDANKLVYEELVDYLDQVSQNSVAPHDNNDGNNPAACIVFNKTYNILGLTALILLYIQ